MKKGCGCLIVVLILIVAAAGAVGYFAYQTLLESGASLQDMTLREILDSVSAG